MVIRNSLLALAALVLAAVFAWRFYEAAFSASHQPDLTAAVTLPLYFAFAVALAVAAFWLVRRLTLPMDGADYYAATNLRLLAADADGRLVQEIGAAAMAGLVRRHQTARRPRCMSCGATSRAHRNPSSWTTSRTSPTRKP